MELRLVRLRQVDPDDGSIHGPWFEGVLQYRDAEGNWQFVPEVDETVHEAEVRLGRAAS